MSCSILVLLFHEHVLDGALAELEAVFAPQLDVLRALDAISVQLSAVCTFEIHQVWHDGPLLDESFEGAASHLLFRSELDCFQLLAELNHCVLGGA